MQCQYCGGSMGEQDTACSLCGKSVEKHAPEVQAAPPGQTDPAPGWSENFSTVYQPPQLSERPRRGKGPLLTAMGVILALVVAAGIYFYPNILLALNPKGYVDLSYNRAESRIQQRLDQIGVAFGSDVSQALQMGQVGSVFALKLTGIQMDGQPIDIPADFLDGISIEMAADIDYEAKRMQGRLDLSLLGEQISGLYYADEEVLALGLPGVYARNFGIYADTFVSDWNASPLGESLPLDTDTKIDLGALFDPSRTLIQNTGPDADSGMEFDWTSLNKLTENATYKNLGQGAMRGDTALYNRVEITLSGADIKAFLKDLLASLSKLTVWGGPDMGYELEEAFAQLDEAAIEDVVVIVYVNGGHRMVGAETTITMEDAEESLVLTLAFGAGDDPLDGCYVGLFSAAGEESFTIGHNVTSSDSRLGGQIYFTLNNGYGAETITIEYAYEPDAPGQNLSVTVDVPMSGTRIALRGGLHADRDAKRLAFTLDNITVDDGFQTVGIDMECKMETFAQSKTVEAWTNVQNVADMSQADWEEIAYNLQEKLMSIVSMISGMPLMMA